MEPFCENAAAAVVVVVVVDDDDDDDDVISSSSYQMFQVFINRVFPGDEFHQLHFCSLFITTKST